MQNQDLFFCSDSPCLNFYTSYIEMYSFTSSFTFLFIYVVSCRLANLLKQKIKNIAKITTEQTPKMIQKVSWEFESVESSLQLEGVGDMLSQMTSKTSVGSRFPL
jgi:hypothetical protein